ncbi:type IV pilus biogenesis protein PilM [Candidatus Latescibacterota bacterium]
MAQGVGVRFNTSGVRILKIEKADDGMKINAIAAGLPGETFISFTESKQITFDDASVAFGLGPGDFLAACLKNNNGMDDDEQKEQLRWEIERKILSDPSGYNFDYFISGGMGFVFAGRKNLINEVISSVGNALTDVEPVALLNSCDSSGECGDGTSMLLSIEAGGISSVIVENGMPLAIDSYLINEPDIASVMSGLNMENISQMEDSLVEKLVGHVFKSVNRLTSFAENKDNPTPDKLILAGSGVYAGKLVSMIEDKYGINVVISDPFTALTNNAADINPELENLNAAFTTCFGLALRAMEV